MGSEMCIRDSLLLGLISENDGVAGQVFGNLKIDVNKDKSLKQSNKLSQSRAKWLKSRVDDLFYM